MISHRAFSASASRQGKQAWQRSMPSMLFIREQPTVSRRRSCRKDESGPVLLDQGLPIKIASPITGIAFDGNCGVPIVSQCCVIAGIFLICKVSCALIVRGYRFEFPHGSLACVAVDGLLPS